MRRCLYPRKGSNTSLNEDVYAEKAGNARFQGKCDEKIITALHK